MIRYNYKNGGGGVNRRFFKITGKKFELLNTEEIDCEDKKHAFNSSMHLLALPAWKYAGICGRILWKSSIRR